MITVEKRFIAVSAVFLSQNKVQLVEEETVTLTATVTPENATDSAVTWETSDPTVATVDQGVVTAVGAGTAIITAKAGDKEATCTVTVEAKYIPLTAILLNPTEMSIEVGESKTIVATMVPENATDNIPTWLSSNKEIASVRRGSVKGVAPGETIITAVIGDIKATCVVKVTLSDGIEQATESELLKIYDITGRPVRLDATSTDGLEQGIYIINGRKTVIK